MAKDLKKKVKGRIMISGELCKSCGYCITACPSNAIAIGKKFNGNGYFHAIPLHPGKCTGCSICAQMCPEIAISVWRQE